MNRRFATASSAYRLTTVTGTYCHVGRANWSSTDQVIHTVPDAF